MNRPTRVADPRPRGGRLGHNHDVCVWCWLPLWRSARAGEGRNIRICRRSGHGERRGEARRGDEVVRVGAWSLGPQSRRPMLERVACLVLVPWSGAVADAGASAREEPDGQARNLVSPPHPHPPPPPPPCSACSPISSLSSSAASLLLTSPGSACPGNASGFGASGATASPFPLLLVAARPPLP